MISNKMIASKAYSTQQLQVEERRQSMMSNEPQVKTSYAQRLGKNKNLRCRSCQMSNKRTQGADLDRDQSEKSRRVFIRLQVAFNMIPTASLSNFGTWYSVPEKRANFDDQDTIHENRKPKTETKAPKLRADTQTLSSSNSSSVCSQPSILEQEF